MRKINLDSSKTGRVYSSCIALLASSMAISQALALDLNIYGVGHVSADSVDNGTDSGTVVASNSSRLGFGGGHDLGGGLKAVFQYEAGVDLTGQSGNDGNGGGPRSGELFTNTRDSFVGIEGNFGKVIGGRFGGLNQWLYDYNLFGDQVGDLGNIWGGTGLAGRVSSALQYQTPGFDGVNIAISYAPDETLTTSNDTTIVKLNYGDGPLKVGGALMNADTAAETHSATAITASYNFGDFDVGGGLQIESDMGGTAGADADSFTIGASMKVNDGGTLKAQFTNHSADANNSDATQIAVGYDHSLNKSTTFYIAYASTDNDPSAGFTANNYGHGDAVSPAAGEDPTALSFGLVVKFDQGLMN